MTEPLATRAVPPSTLSSLTQTVDVETPELVVFSYALAGIGSRMLAALLDAFICFIAIMIVLAFGALAAPRGAMAGSSRAEAWATAITAFASFAVMWGYYVVFEGLSDGQTPGKKILRLRVVRDGGYSVTFGASAVRNLIRLVDIQPFGFPIIGLASMFFSSAGKRLGDFAAGTMVVREELTRDAPPAPAQAATPADAPPASPMLHTALREEEFVLLEAFMRRRGSLDAAPRAALAARIAARLGPSLAGGTMDSLEGSTDLARLVRLYESERDARARGVVSRHDRDAARERNIIIASRSLRWNQFASRLTAAQRFGLSALGEAGVREFVAEYRDLTADLARLRTAARGRASPELFYLSRLVAGAHNLLYRSRGASLFEAVRFLVVAAPTEVRRSWRPILLAAALLFGPAVVAYTAVVSDPSVAATFIPSGMLDRAEEGVRRARENTGYIPDPQIFRPVMASQIIANNVQVTFAVFAFGMTAGVMTLYLLVMNGVSFGGVMGLYVSKGIGSLLLAFVAPHGVLELSAVCIAGGAGFLLAAALLLPGRRSRRRALAENSRRAIRLVAASVVLLLVAGALEGFVSPIPSWSLRAKLAVSAATAVLLALYLSSGIRIRRAPPSVAAPNAPEELLGLG